VAGVGQGDVLGREMVEVAELEGPMQRDGWPYRRSAPPRQSQSEQAVLLRQSITPMAMLGATPPLDRCM